MTRRILFILLITSLSLNCSQTNTNSTKQITFKDFNINIEPKIKTYGIQKLLTVPNIQVITLSNENKLILYRTEFHNGSENGCILVINTIKDNKLIPIFIFEELFYLSDNEYYLRELDSVTDKQIRITLFKSIDNKREKIATSTYLIKNDGNFKIDKTHEYTQGNTEIIQACSEVFDSIKNKIIQGKY